MNDTNNIISLPMEFQRDPTDPANPIVFMDIAIENEIVGRIIIELRADVVPLSAENFRCLCTGEKGFSTVRPDVRLHYEGTHFTYVHRMFACRGGDVTHSGGSDGESIYGPRFAHENYSLPNTSGAVGMVHGNQPDSNNSQFYICSSDSSHLDGSNVVVGYVLRGFGAVLEIEKYCGEWSVDRYAPTQKIYVARCGQIDSGDPWNYVDDDYTEDRLPPFPLDWQTERVDGVIPLQRMVWALETIRDAAKLQLTMADYLLANRRYKKCERYHAFFVRLLPGDPGRDARDILDAIVEQTYNNRSLCELKLCHWAECIELCARTLRQRPSLVHAHFRRGKAHLHLRNYDESLADLNVADRLAPRTPDIVEVLAAVREHWHRYMDSQKQSMRGMFK